VKKIGFLINYDLFSPKLLNRKGEKEEVTAKYIIVAVGGRP